MSSEFISPGKKIWMTGHELRLQGNFELAIDLFHDILSSPASQDTVLKVDTLNELVICNRAIHAYDESMDYSLEALHLAKSVDYKEGMANALLNLGALAHLSHSLKDSKHFFRQSLSIFESELNDKLGVAKVLLHLGLVSRDEGMIEKAEGDLYTAYKQIEKEYNDPEYRYVLIRVLIHLGNTKLLDLNFVEGIKLFKESLAFSENTKDESKKPMILRNLALCYLILDHDKEFSELINESITISSIRKQITEEYFSKIYLLLYYFRIRDNAYYAQTLAELQQITTSKFTHINFLIFFITAMMKNANVDGSIAENLKEMEDYYRSNNHNIKQNQNLVLLEIEFVRILNDQIIAQQGGYSFGLSRKFEKLIRIARGHKEERIYLIAYNYLLDLLIPKIRTNSGIKDENNDLVMNLLKQIKNDIAISKPLFIQIFSILEVLITIFYTMDFSQNISKLVKVKSYFAERKMTELELRVFRLENDLSEKLAKLTEVTETELNNIDNIKNTVFTFQQQIRSQITEYLQFFSLKILEVLFLLNDITN